MEVVVGVGGGEHQCCGEAVERNQLVDFRCLRYPGPDAVPRFAESRHGGDDDSADEQVRGRVTEIQVVRPDGAVQAVLRLPSGQALRGCDDSDDGHLEDPWTGELVASRSTSFLVTVQTSSP